MRRGNAFQILCLLATAVAATGCRSTPASWVESSSKDSSYNKSIHKLFILAKLTTKGWVGKGTTGEEVRLMNYRAFKENLESIFKKNGIECDCEVLTGLELEDSNYEAKIKVFSPDAYMVINCVSITLQDDLLIQQNYEVSLIDYPSDKRVWRANVEYYQGGFINGKAMALKIYNTITLGLKDDGLNVLGIIEPAGNDEK